MASSVRRVRPLAAILGASTRSTSALPSRSCPRGGAEPAGGRVLGVRGEGRRTMRGSSAAGPWLSSLLLFAAVSRATSSQVAAFRYHAAATRSVATAAGGGAPADAEGLVVGGGFGGGGQRHTNRARCYCDGSGGAMVEGVERDGAMGLRGGSSSGSGDKLKWQEEGGGVAGDGRIEIIMGPMFAGKSTELMRRIRRHKLAWRSCVVIKYSSDQRHGEATDELSTHDKVRIKAIPTKTLFDVWDQVQDHDVVGVDEAQFYPDLVEFCDRLADQGKMVILSALDGTFQREPFGRVLELIPRAEAVTKLSSVCKLCRREASFTRRTTADTQLEAIGGSEMYMPTCRRCHKAPIAPDERPTVPARDAS